MCVCVCIRTCGAYVSMYIVYTNGCYCVCTYVYIFMCVYELRTQTVCLWCVTNSMCIFHTRIPKTLLLVVCNKQHVHFSHTNT